MFDRLALLIEKENLNKIMKKKVMVIGIGGVGGSCVLSLIRSGISNIVIIDYDTVDRSNLNRQAVAFNSTIGMKKIDVMEKIILEINDKCCVQKYDLFLNGDNIKMIFDREKPDYIIDCCDTRDTKKEIILEAINRNISFITSMGTGNKLDPTKLSITKIKNTINDPLARIFRKWAKDMKIEDKIMVISSSELPKKTGKIVSSCSFVPNCAGLLIASYVINDIIGNKIYMKGRK